MAREHQIQANRADANRFTGFITEAGEPIPSQDGRGRTEGWAKSAEGHPKKS
jgi:hypothetical protein